MYKDISGNLGDLQKNLSALGQEIEGDVKKNVIKKVLFNLWTLVTEGGDGCDGTPIKTGRARGSWMLDTAPSDWSLPPGDYTQAINNNMLAAISALPDSDKYYLFNNLEYIVPLENGHSQQAPQGFVAQAIAVIGIYVAKAATAAGYKAKI